MLEVIQVLMNRDKLTEQEALAWVCECRADIERLCFEQNSGYEPEEIVMDQLGLEPDYLVEILGA